MTELFFRRISLLPAALITLAFAGARAGEKPFFRSELIFLPWNTGTTTPPASLSCLTATCWSAGTMVQGSARQGEVKPDREGRPMRKAIKHAHFNEAWILAAP